MLVTGGRGFVASEVAEVARSRRWTVIDPGREALDVTRPDAVRAALAEARPDVVVHTAYREREPGLREVTVGGTAVVAAACAAAGSRLVHLSSDMVFTDRDGVWREEDGRCPQTAYGRAKADAEAAVEAAVEVAAEAAGPGPGWSAVIVRTSLVLAGPGRAPGRHERLVLDVLDGRARVVFFTDEIRRPVLVRTLAEAVVDLAAMGAPPPVVHVAGTDPMSRIALARRIAGWHHRDASALAFGPIASVALAEPRPGRVVLDIGLAQRIGLLPPG